MQNSNIKKSILLVSLFLFNYLHGQTPTSSDKDFSKQPQLTWKTKIRGSIVATPVNEGNSIFIGSLDSTLYALDKDQGKIIWMLRTGGPIRSTVCIFNETLFLLSDDGILYCINKTKGNVVWVFRSFNGYMGDRRNDFADYYSSSPIIFNGTIYFGLGEYVYAVNSIDGKLIWNYKTGDVVHTRPAINNDKLFIGSFDGTLYSLNINTGSLYWKFKTVGHRFFPKGEVMGSPVVGKNLVYFGARDYNFYAVDINGGYCHWMKQFPKGWALPATINDSIVLLGTSDDRLLFAYDLSTGSEIWRLNAGFNIFGEIAIDKKTGYFGTLAGKVIGFDLKAGTILWELKLDGYNTNHLKYLKLDDSYRDDISNLIRSSQDILKMYYNLGGVFSKPAISDNNMIITCYDGNIYCFKQ